MSEHLLLDPLPISPLHEPGSIYNSKQKAANKMNELIKNGIFGLINQKILRYLTVVQQSKSNEDKLLMRNGMKLSKKRSQFVFKSLSKKKNYHLTFVFNGKLVIKLELTDINYINSYRDIMHIECSCKEYHKIFKCQHCAAILLILRQKKIDHSKIHFINEIEYKNNTIQIGDVVINQESIPADFSDEMSIKQLNKWIHSPNAIYGIIILFLRTNIVSPTKPKCVNCNESNIIFNQNKVHWWCLNCNEKYWLFDSSYFEEHLKLTTSSSIVNWFKFMVFFFNNCGNLSIGDICKLASCNYNNGFEWSKEIRNICGIVRNHLPRILGRRGSIVEYDGKYFKSKSKGDKIDNKSALNVPTWFKGNSIQRFIERDYNEYSNHSSYTTIIRAESTDALKHIESHVLPGTRLQSDGCGNICSKKILDNYQVAQCNHKKLKFVILEDDSIIDVKSDNKISNSNCENSWKFICNMNNMMRGFKLVQNVPDSLSNFAAWLAFFDWINCYTIPGKYYKFRSRIIRFINDLMMLYPSRSW